MQSLHYNSGSIKLTRERSTMVSRWEAREVAQWIGGSFVRSQTHVYRFDCFHFFAVKVSQDYLVILVISFFSIISMVLH